MQNLDPLEKIGLPLNTTNSLLFYRSLGCCSIFDIAQHRVYHARRVPINNEELYVLPGAHSNELYTFSFLDQTDPQTHKPTTAVHIERCNSWFPEHPGASKALTTSHAQEPTGLLTLPPLLRLENFKREAMPSWDAFINKLGSLKPFKPRENEVADKALTFVMYVGSRDASGATPPFCIAVDANTEWYLVDRNLGAKFPAEFDKAQQRWVFQMGSNVYYYKTDKKEIHDLFLKSGNDPELKKVGLEALKSEFCTHLRTLVAKQPEHLETANQQTNGLCMDAAAIQFDDEVFRAKLTEALRNLQNPSPQSPEATSLFMDFLGFPNCDSVYFLDGTSAAARKTSHNFEIDVPTLPSSSLAYEASEGESETDVIIVPLARKPSVVPDTKGRALAATRGGTSAASCPNLLQLTVSKQANNKPNAKPHAKLTKSAAHLGMSRAQSALNLKELHTNRSGSPRKLNVVGSTTNGRSQSPDSRAFKPTSNGTSNSRSQSPKPNQDGRNHSAAPNKLNTRTTHHENTESVKPNGKGLTVNTNKNQSPRRKAKGINSVSGSPQSPGSPKFKGKGKKPLIAPPPDSPKSESNVFLSQSSLSEIQRLNALSGYTSDPGSGPSNAPSPTSLSRSNINSIEVGLPLALRKLQNFPQSRTPSPAIVPNADKKTTFRYPSAHEISKLADNEVAAISKTAVAQHRRVAVSGVSKPNPSSTLTNKEALLTPGNSFRRVPSAVSVLPKRREPSVVPKRLVSEVITTREEAAAMPNLTTATSTNKLRRMPSVVPEYHKDVAVRPLSDTDAKSFEKESPHKDFWSRAKASNGNLQPQPAVVPHR